MATQPQHEEPTRAWDELGELVERTQRYAREGAEELLDALPLSSTERIADEARAAADRVLDRAGLPSTSEIEDAVEKIVQTVRIPEPFRPRLPTPQRVWQDAQRGAAWIEDQLEPLRDKLDPFDPDQARVQIREREPHGEPAEDDGWGVIEWAAFSALLWFLDWLTDGELTLEIDIDHALWSFDEKDDGRFEQWSKTVFEAPAGYAARVGDVMMHGDAIAPGLGSPNVFIGGRPALRVCDSHVCTKSTPVPHVSTGFLATYDKVEINGFAALRVGDSIDEGPHGLNPIVVGCPSVVIGPKPEPVECWQPGEAKPMRRPDRHPFRWRRGQVGHFKGKLVLGADLGGAFVRVEGTVTAARLWAEESHVHDQPLGDIDGDGKVEAWRVSARGKSERALGVSDVELEARWPGRNRITKQKLTPKPNEAKSDLTVDHELVELP